MIHHKTLGTIFILLGTMVLLCVMIIELYLIISGEYTIRNIVTVLIITTFLVYIWYQEIKRKKTERADTKNSDTSSL